MEEVIPVDPFLELWHDLMIILAIVTFFGGVIIYLIYHLKVSLRTDFKEKHDFINESEVKWYKWTAYFLASSLAFLVNLYGERSLTEINISFYVRIFFGVSAGVIVGYVSNLILENYWPTQVNRKLKKWRYMPRINPKTGNKMRLLAEDEEDVHLPEGMQAEEKTFSIDYDVWIDEKTNDIKIEKYMGRLLALQCRNCSFYTMRVQREEIVEYHPDGSPKELVKYYQCTYCKNVRATQFKISRKEASDYINQKPHFSARVKSVELVRVEIHSALEGKQFFEFQTLDQAESFLKEYASSEAK
jgi:hypothetical protein